MSGHRPRPRRWVAVAAFALAVAVGGCGGRHPVTGRVLLDGKPLEGKEGAVVLRPDAGKGNDSRVSPTGVLQRDGTFSVQTGGRPGAPRGWYKVVVTATDPTSNPNDDVRPAVPARYRTAAQTPLSLEVVADPAPGSYDLQLSR
jgi:hypothetical protein